ncbi:LysR family transcriptional regulator [Labrys sp. KB_33_2]
MTSLQAFVHTVDCGSIARAARELRLSAVMVGRHIASLEDQFGTRLLHRTTRRLTLTDPGRTVYNTALLIVREYGGLSRSMESLKSDPSGHLRVTAPVAFAEKVGAILADFCSTYPSIFIEVLCDDRALDMVEHKLDLAIRVGRLPDSGLIARKLAPAHVVVCAAPAYLTARGIPLTIDDISDHDCVAYEHQWAGEGWAFSDGQREVTVKLAHVSCRSNNAQVQRAFVLAGKGLAQMPAFIVEDDIRQGRLVPVLTAQPILERWMHAVYQPGGPPPLAIRVLVDFLVTRFKPG